MWETLSSIDRDRIYAKDAAGTWRPMLDLLNGLRRHRCADRLSAYTSHFQLVVTFAIAYADQERADRVTIDYRPTLGPFNVAYLRPFTSIPVPSDSATCDAASVLTVAGDFVERLVAAGEVKTTRADDAG